MAKKTKLSVARHWELAGELREMFNRLSTLVVEIGTAYPMSGERGKAYSALGRALAAVKDARLSLDGLANAEYPEDVPIGLYSDGEPPKARAH